VLGERMFIKQVATAKGWDERITARRFKAALEHLADLWGFTGQAPSRKHHHDKFSDMATAAVKKPMVEEVAVAA
jgi:hypothetical protein